MSSSIREQFHTYYGLSEPQKKAIWKKCTFVLDTNVLLDLYRYTEDSKQEMLKVLKGLKSKLWMPHQVGLEYSRRRPSVILDQRSLIEKASSVLDGLSKNASNEIGEKLKFRDHPYIDKESIIGDILSCIESIKRKLNEEIEEYPHDFNDDPILDRLEEIFSDSLGSPFSDEDLKEIYEEGETRYREKTPPGFEDSSKDKDENRFGDLLIWKQILDHAKSHSSHVVFITNDNKEDWWWKEKGRRLGPHPDLVSEFRAFTGKNFLIYNPDQFLSQAKDRMKLSLNEDFIDEVKRVASNKLERSALEDYEEGFSSTAMDPNRLAHILSNHKQHNENLSAFTANQISELARLENFSASIADQLKKINSPNSKLAKTLLDADMRAQEKRQQLINSITVNNRSIAELLDMQQNLEHANKAREILLSNDYLKSIESASAGIDGLPESTLEKLIQAIEKKEDTDS